MPYFFIVPAYVLLVVGMTVLAVVARFVPRLRPTSGYVAGGAVGTLPGFVVANVLISIAGLLPVWAAQHVSLPEWLHNVLKVFVAAVLLIGPFVASLLGVALGFAGGICYVWLRRRKKHA
jgi:hypothetical protein